MIFFAELNDGTQWLLWECDGPDCDVTHGHPASPLVLQKPIEETRKLAPEDWVVMVARVKGEKTLTYCGATCGATAAIMAFEMTASRGDN